MDTVILVQARMGSSRLPGKVLLPLAGESVLARVVERCRAAGVGPVVVATTTEGEDDAVAAAARRAGAAVFRGPALDVMGRFAAAARDHAAAHYVRVTADCPLLDPEIVRDVVAAHAAGGYDFSYNDIPVGYPRGYDVEVMTAATLAWLDTERSDDVSREHVTPYLFEHPPGFRVLHVTRRGDCTAYRLTLDEAVDYEVIKVIYERLVGARPFGLAAVLRLLTGEPGLALTNAAVAQRSPPQTSS